MHLTPPMQNTEKIAIKYIATRALFDNARKSQPGIAHGIIKTPRAHENYVFLFPFSVFFRVCFFVLNNKRTDIDSNVQILK